jgi:hypothetical protein
MGNTNARNVEQIANEQNVYRTTRWMARGALGTGIAAVVIALALEHATCDQPLSQVLGVMGAIYLIYGVLELLQKPPSADLPGPDTPTDRRLGDLSGPDTRTRTDRRWMISAAAVILILWIVAMVYVWLSTPCNSVAAGTACCDARLVTGTKFCVFFFASWYLFWGLVYACCWHKKEPASSG